MAKSKSRLLHLSTVVSSAVAALTGLAARLKHRAAGWSWTPLLLRGLASLLALVGLGYVGSQASVHT